MQNAHRMSLFIVKIIGVTQHLLPYVGENDTICIVRERCYATPTLFRRDLYEREKDCSTWIDRCNDREHAGRMRTHCRR